MLRGFARTRAITPATEASRMFSIRVCRISRPGEAPSADRVAVSSRRPAATARSRLATFAHTRRRSPPAAAIMIRTVAASFRRARGSIQVAWSIPSRLGESRPG